MKKLPHLIALALCLFTLVSCSASGSDYNSAAALPSDEGVKDIYGSSLGGADSAEITDDTTADLSDRKLIRDVDLSVETKAFDTLIGDLTARTKALGGYIEQSYLSGNSYSAESGNRYATVTCRIPAERLDEFLASMGENCNIISQNETAQDVTLTYVDLESRIKALEAERDALTTMLEKADTTADILTIRSQLTEVIYKLESATASLRSLSERVSYSSVSLSIREVQTYSAPAQVSFWERISTGFLSSLKNVGGIISTLFIWLIVGLPYLLILAVIAVCIILLIRFISKRQLQKQMKASSSAPDPNKPQ